MKQSEVYLVHMIGLLANPNRKDNLDEVARDADWATEIYMDRYCVTDDDEVESTQSNGT